MKLEISGDTVALKNWMDSEKKRAVKAEKQFEKARNALRKEMRKKDPQAQLPTLTSSEVKRIEGWQEAQRFCDTRYIQPIAIGAVVVNGKLLVQMLKKIEGLPIAMTVDKDVLVLQYDAPGGEGSLELYDLSNHYPEKLVPEGVLVDG
ncbi:hypothetical protein BTO30_12355 [Domibacillus antri]|uniref:Uncharacterized protein n=1 Tax=Domibacillus antri TaxID=1714264 RepID=A0A1Q8Q3H1_9BACI|nr:hypothetical protein [Domibacillus antri]OLN21884.1 hypothetical protein BTO30_12355 [Domibacillus antri]